MLTPGREVDATRILLARDSRDRTDPPYDDGVRSMLSVSAADPAPGVLASAAASSSTRANPASTDRGVSSDRPVGSGTGTAAKLTRFPVDMTRGAIFKEAGGAVVVLPAADTLVAAGRTAAAGVGSTAEWNDSDRTRDKMALLECAFSSFCPRCSCCS